MKSFGDLSQSRHNHFDLLRLLLALGVLYSHSFVLIGQNDDGIARLTHNQLAASTFALYGFFLVSGYLIAGSWERSRSWKDYALRRARRIIPGFFVAILVCFFIVGPLGAHSAAEYFHDRSEWKFLGFLLMRVPEGAAGVFQSNPDAGVIDGSLWTIRLEISCYVLLALAGSASALRNRAVTSGLALLTIAIWFAAPHLPTRLHIPFYFWGMIQMSIPFAIGTAAFVWRSSIPASGWIFCVCIAALAITALTGGLSFSMWIAGSYVILFFGLLPGEVPILKKIGDLSYGTYLYAFPVQQLIVHWMHRPGPWTVIALTIPITLILAWLSWNFIESPLLQRPGADRNIFNPSNTPVHESISVATVQSTI